MHYLLISNYIFFIENDLMSEIEKLSEEKHLQSQKILQLEHSLQKSSKLNFLNKFIGKLIYIITLESEKHVKTKSWQENKCTCSNLSADGLKETINAERKEYEKKLEKLIKSQLDPLMHNKRSSDLEIAVSKLRAERDEYLYEINILKKHHKTEVIYATLNKLIK